jgi:hypothetical protein
VRVLVLQRGIMRSAAWLPESIVVSLLCRCCVYTSLSCTVATRGDNSEPNRDDDVIVLCWASANR